MAMIVRAQLKEFESRKLDPEKRYGIKRELYRKCFREGFGMETARVIFKFIDWLIQVPIELQEKIKTDMKKFEEEYKMNYLPYYEREAHEEGIKEGIERGIERGQSGVLKSLINKGYDIDSIASATGIPREKIEALIHAA